MPYNERMKMEPIDVSLEVPAPEPDEEEETGNHFMSDEETRTKKKTKDPGTTVGEWDHRFLDQRFLDQRLFSFLF
jgi:hypothetical protein